MTMVKASDAVPRLAPNSVWTTGSATTTDHMPTLPSEPMNHGHGKPDPRPARIGNEQVGISGEIRRNIHGGRNFVR
jgi:hypothetical protein